MADFLVILHRHLWSRPIQLTLGHIMVLVSICAVILARSQLSVAMLIILSLLTSLILGPYFLARGGFKLVDIATVVILALLTIGLMLSAILQTRILTGGRYTFPFTIPSDLHPLILRDR
jgi:hypothetical protein